MNIHSMMNYDAQAAMSFVVSQNTHIEAGVYQTKYQDIQYTDLLAGCIDTSANPWVKTVTYYSGDQYGVANWINGNADDINIAGSEMTKFESSVYTGGIGYGWGYEEIRQAQTLGIPLQDNDARAARRAYEEFLDKVFLTGDARKNMKGLINNASVTATAAATGDWGGTGTNEQTIIGDVNQVLLATGTDTLWTGMSDTLLMSPGKLLFLASNWFTANPAAGTLLEWIKKYNVYTQKTGNPLMIRSMIGLETAGVGNVERMVAYRRSPEVLKAHLPLPLFFLPPWQAGPLRWEVPGLFRLGGLDIRLPKEVHYLDGI